MLKLPITTLHIIVTELHCAGSQEAFCSLPVPYSGSSNKSIFHMRIPPRDHDFYQVRVDHARRAVILQVEFVTFSREPKEGCQRC